MDIKQEVVEKDFHEKNIRKTLNFGHTIGHAVESLCLEKGNPILHGEAVALGMICETYLSFFEGLISEQDSEKIIENIQRYFPFINLDEFKDDDLFNVLLNDKKNTNAKINFSLLSEIGHCVFDYECTTENILTSINFYKKRSGF